MKIALLGPNGFVGQNIVDEFNRQDISYFPVSRQHGFDLTKKEDNIRFLKVSGCTVVLNCAAHVGSLNYVTEKAADIVNDNTQMVLALFEAVKEYNPAVTIIQPIANCAFPANATAYKEHELWNGPLHPSILSYGLTRRFIIAASECYKMQYGINTVNLFTPNMYGPFDSTDPNKAHALNALVSKFVKAGKEGTEEVEVWGTGVVIREWLYARDFARIVACLLKNPDQHNYTQPVSVAQNWGLSIKELVALIVKSFGYEGQINWNRNMPDGALKKVMDDTEFRKIFPDFQFTPMEQGIQETTDYYISRYPF